MRTKIDYWEGLSREKIYEAGEIFVPPGLYRVEEIAEKICTIRLLPAGEDCIAFRFHQPAPSTWKVGFVVECRPNPTSPTGRTIKLREAWEV